MKTRLFIALSLLFTAAFAQNPLNLLSTTKGGSCYEVCYYNNYLYAGCANTLMVFPTNGPNNSPGTPTDSIRFISNIDYMVVRNGFLYICANHDGLWKYNVSNPAQPVYVAHYAPATNNESIYDIAFYGDSVFVAAKTKVNLLKDNGTSFSFLRTVATYTSTNNTTRVRGVDVKDTLLAFTVGYSPSNTQDGVYLFGVKGCQQVSFYNDTQCDPQDVCFGKNTQLLHVMGGTISSTFFDGRYYALNYSVPTSPSLAFSQTINGLAILGSISMPMNCTNINDTLYISTQGGGPYNYSGGTFSGQIYVFDAHTPTVSFITDIYAGLYHFDCDVNPVTHKLYVASEWYGVLTMDITNLMSETQVKRTNTGGWCHGSARAKSKLAEASEGFGMRLFDVSNMQYPQLIATDTTVGFARAISISDSADYVYGWFVTGKALRVRNATNLGFVKDTTGDPSVSLPTDFKKSRYYNGKVAVIEEYGIGNGSHSILVGDVSNPTQAHIIAIRQKNNIEDILWHPSGVLMALANDSLMVLNASTLATITSIIPPFGGLQPYKAFCLSNDTLYVHYDNFGEGIARYKYDPGLQTLTYLSALPFQMKTTNRIFLACDNSLLYISGTLDSLKALSKTNLSQVAIYNHGSDHVFDNLWGNTDLYYNKGYLFLNEYMGQTSIFGPPNSTGISTAVADKNKLSVYPNPATEYFTIHTGTREECMVSIYDTQGKLMYIADVRSEKFTLSTEGFHKGLYFVSVIANGKEVTTKLLIEK